MITASVAVPTPTMKVSSSTLDSYAAAAGQKYMKLYTRIKQVVKDAPVMGKVVQEIKAFDQRMTEKHPVAYKFTKGLVVGTTIGVGLTVAGPAVASAYAAVNAVRTTGNLLAKAEEARQKGEVTGFKDFVSKNKAAVIMTGVSVGLSAAGLSAGVINNSVATSVIASARKLSVGGMMTANTAITMHHINSDVRSGKITEEQGKQLKKEHFAELTGNLAGLAATSLISSEIAKHREEKAQEQKQEQEKPAEKVQDKAPEKTVEKVPEEKPVEKAPSKEPAPEQAPTQQNEEPVHREQFGEKLSGRGAQLENDQAQMNRGIVRDNSNVERSASSSIIQDIEQNANSVLIRDEEINHINGAGYSQEAYARAEDVQVSNAKILTIETKDGLSSFHIAEDGKTVELPKGLNLDVNGDGRVSAQEAQNYKTSLMSVLSEQEANNVTASKTSNVENFGKGPSALQSQTDTGHVQYNGSSDGYNPDNAANAVARTAKSNMDKFLQMGEKLMGTRVSGDGNVTTGNSTSQQNQAASAILHQFVGKSR